MIQLQNKARQGGVFRKERIGFSVPKDTPKPGCFFMEIWKDIKGCEGKYQVSNLGNVKSLTRKIKTKKGIQIHKETLLKPGIGKRGYYVVVVNKKTKHVHRLVAETFIDNVNKKYTVNHVDGNKLNNNIENLEWATSQENSKHAVKIGLIGVGEKNTYHKLKDADITEIRKSKLKAKELARIYNTAESNIYHIKNKRTWIHLE